MQRRPDDVALEREPVAVAPRELHDGLDAVVVQRQRDGERGRVRVRARVVGDVDRVGPLAERLELAFHLGDAAAVDRRHLGRDGRTTGEQCVLEAGHHAATGASRCESSSLAFLTALDASAE